MSVNISVVTMVGFPVSEVTFNEIIEKNDFFIETLHDLRKETTGECGLVSSSMDGKWWFGKILEIGNPELGDFSDVYVTKLQFQKYEHEVLEEWKRLFGIPGFACGMITAPLFS